MARVTVEDCVTRVPNRFDLVITAAQRARQIGAGAPLTLDRDNDRNPVVALREIAEGTVSVEDLQSALVKSLQKVVEIEEPIEEEMDLLVMAQDISEEISEPLAEEEIAEDELHVEGEGTGEIAAADDEVGIDAEKEAVSEEGGEEGEEEGAARPEEL